MESSPRVDVAQGTIIGGAGQLPNGTVYNFFKGIPYAVPPLGELRFKAPVALEKFATPEINCTKEGDVSFQKDGNTGKILGSEDCLFLNVYVPKSEVDAPLPVMVYLHGGGYTFGSANSDMYNPIYLIQENVVVVTVNYRLGPLGFLAFPEAGVPGNAGLKDQRLALQWVQQNISKFNGDAGNVTLFGESAGAGCVHFHLLSEVSRKYFHKVIIQSGAGTMPWALEERGSYKTKLWAKSLGCSSDDPKEIMSFLQSYENLNDFLQALLPSSTLDQLFTGRPVPARPVLEKESADAVVTKSPLEAMKDLNTLNIPIMMGHTSAEGIVVLPTVMPKVEECADNLHKFIPHNLNMSDAEKVELVNSIKEIYFKGKSIGQNTLNELSDLLGDIFFIVDAQEAAEIFSRKQPNAPLYFYRFDYDGAMNFYKKKIFKFEGLRGASHADELFYLFQTDYNPEPWEENAKKMVRTVCKLWGNFAKYSNPTQVQDDELVKLKWEPVKKISDNDEFTLNALAIDDPLKIIVNPNRERVALWNKVRATYLKPAL